MAVLTNVKKETGPNGVTCTSLSSANQDLTPNLTAVSVLSRCVISTGQSGISWPAPSEAVHLTDPSVPQR